MSDWDTLVALACRTAACGVDYDEAVENDLERILRAVRRKYAIVPREATGEMCRAGQYEIPYQQPAVASKCWSAMLCEGEIKPAEEAPDAE